MNLGLGVREEGRLEKLHTGIIIDDWDIKFYEYSYFCSIGLG